jgi:hypothetical protein
MVVAFPLGISSRPHSVRQLIPHCYSLHANHSTSTTPSVDDQSTSDNLDNPEHPVPNYQEHRTRDLTVRSHSPQVQVPVRRLIDDGPSATTLVYDKRQIARSSRTSTQSGPVVGNCSPRSISTSYHITICTLEIRRRQIKSQATHVRLKVSAVQLGVWYSQSEGGESRIFG